MNLFSYSLIRRKEFSGNHYFSLNLRAVYRIFTVDLFQCLIPSGIEISITDEHPGLQNVFRKFCDSLPEITGSYQNVTALCGKGGVEGQHVLVGINPASYGPKVIYFSSIKVFGNYIREPRELATISTINNNFFL